MNMRLMILAAALLSVGCDIDEFGPGTGPTVPPPGPFVPTQNFIPIAIADSGYVPSEIPVRVGVAVRFVNNGTQAHTVSFTSSVFSSGSIQPGAFFTVAFREPGTFPYKCAFHEGMTGKLVVNN